MVFDPCPAPINLCGPDCLLNVQPDLVRLTGLLQWDGAAIPQSGANGWNIIFTDPVGGESWWVQRDAGDSSVQTYDVPVLAGTWAISYAWTSTPGDSTSPWPDPIWGQRELLASLNVPPGGGTANLEPDPLRMTGLLQWDAAAIAQSGANTWWLRFTDPYTGQSFTVERDASDGAVSTYDIPVYDGVYDVSFEWVSTPANTSGAWPDPIEGSIPIQVCGLIQ